MTAGGATLVVPAGAVTGQVIAHLKVSSISVLQAVTPSARLMLKSVGEAVEVDLSGQQPLRPLTLTLRVTGAADHPALAIITNHQGTASVLMGTLSRDRLSYTVKVSKLSVFQLVTLNPSAVLKTFTDGIKVALGTLGVYGDKPSCFGKSATMPDGGRVQVTGVRGPLWPCVSAVGNIVTVTVHSVDALPWQVRARAGDYAGAAEADSKAAAIQAIYAALASDRPNADGLVLPQDKGQWTVPVAELPFDMAGKVSIGAWLSSAVVFSVLYLADAASFGQAGDANTLAKGFQQAIGSKASGWDCVVSAARAVPDGAAPSTGQLVALLQAAVACAGPLAKPVLGSDLGGLATLALDIVGGGAAVVVGGLEGALRTATGTDTTTWQVSSLQPVTAPVTAADLLSAPVPALRGNPAGRLVNGTLPNHIPGGLVQLAQTGGTAPARGDFTGDGVPDSAAVIGATSGAGGWDEVVELYTNKDYLLGGFDPAGATNFEHATIRTMVVRNGDVILGWQSFNMSDGRAEFWSAYLRWDGHNVVVTNLVPVQLGWD